jgi:hypothetical protein
MLFGPNPARALDPAGDHLISLDLATMTATAYPLPPDLAGADAVDQPFQLQADGTPFFVGTDSAIPGIIGRNFSAAHWADGSWVAVRQPLPVIPDDPREYPHFDGDIAAMFSVPAGANIDSTGLVLQGVGRDGNALWTRPDIISFNTEGFDTTVSDGIVLAVGCAGKTDPNTFECPNPIITGLNASDGTTLWQQDGFFGVVLVAGDYALVTDGATSRDASADVGWNLMDIRTGTLIDGEHWDDPAAFGQGCCDDNTLFTARFGGTVVSVNDRQVNIYFPAKS